jgi:hypothetical protein
MCSPLEALEHLQWFKFATLVAVAHRLVAPLQKHLGCLQDQLTKGQSTSL